MKYLISFLSFNESIEINATDQPDEKMAKQGINNLENQIKQYKVIKPKIEQIYNITKNPIEVETELKKVLIKEEDRSNPFVAELLKINRLQKEILDGRKSQMDDKMKVDEYSDEERNADASQKGSITLKLKEIKDRMATSETLIQKKSKELKELLKSHGVRMQEMEKKLKEDTAKIKNIV